MATPTYHDGMRRLQDLRETRALADRLEKVTMRSVFTERTKASSSDAAWSSSRPRMKWASGVFIKAAWPASCA